MKKSLDTITSASYDEFHYEKEVIKMMCKVTTTLLEHEHTYYNFYGKGRERILQEEKNKVKKDLVLLLSNIEILTEMLGIREEVKTKTEMRLKKVAERIEKKNVDKE